MKTLTRISRHAKGHLEALFHGADLSLRHRHDQAQTVRINNLNNRHGARLPGRNDAIERRVDVEIGLGLRYATQYFAGSGDVVLRGRNGPFVGDCRLVGDHQVVVGNYARRFCGRSQMKIGALIGCEFCPCGGKLRFGGAQSGLCLCALCDKLRRRQLYQ